MTDEPKQLQAIRSDVVAISYETRKGLRYVSRALGMPNADALAEQVLWEWLQGHHPDVVMHIEDFEDYENQFERELKAKLNPDPFTAKPN